MPVQAKQVEIIPVEENLNGDLSKEIYYECDFCNKRIPLHPFVRNFCEKLSGDNYYCNFCLRHGFHTKNNRNVLIFTFRTIIGHYYQELYVNPIPSSKKMYFKEIQAYIDSHVKAGLLNPTLAYDSETYLWYADFSRIGKGNKKLKLNDMLKTVINILACFNLKSNIPSISVHTLYDKYKDAMYKFYTARYRPADRIILAPTLFSVPSKPDLRLFTSDLLLPNAQ
jgi:hypothetical protein